jgi:hypothetical protein
MSPRALFISMLVAVLTVAAAVQAGATGRGNDFDSYDWTEVNEGAPWSARAGLEAVAVGKSFYVLGGRTPNPWVAPPNGPLPGDSTLQGDVWRSDDRGASWRQVLATDDENHWPARAYHEVVTRGRTMFLLGGQNISVVNNPDCEWFEQPPCGPPFFQSSEFFDDVWSSKDGVNWTELTDNAPWAGRAGLSAAVFKGEIYVMGGSYVDDPAIGGSGERVVLNDVWKSRDGKHWEKVKDRAPWDPRAGAAVVVKGSHMYLLGGEKAFLPTAEEPQPYFNDVWRTADGSNWEQVTASAGWSPRPGHTCDVLRGSIVCFGGFGLSTNPAESFEPSNPMDVWVSRDGAQWRELEGPPWNASDPAEIKYDYDTVVAPSGPNGRGRAIYTFGGDRETFNFFDPTQWLNVDNDVWRFSLPRRGPGHSRR